MNKIKVQNVLTKVVKDVPKSLAGDYLGTGEYKIYEDTKKTVEPKEESISRYYSRKEEK